ncbi:MAG: hypothetical protein IPJ77_19445 [Planctomycetes bacterium]|nr:hypothetical protein [Planctomycetota bacterium]
MSGAASGGRPAWSDVRAVLERAGFRPSRRFGQNFLLDENMVRAIVRDAELPPDSTVLEVGPGCGFLTVHLAAEVRRLLSVEIDPRLLEVAREVRRPRTSSGSARTSSRASTRSRPTSPRRCPLASPGASSRTCRTRSARRCSSSSPRPRNPPRAMTVLVQREVADRIVARPGTPDWGPLSIRLQLDHAARTCRPVPAALFWPRPEVESTVVRLERRPGVADRVARAALAALVTGLFQRRRQALGRVLAERLGREAANHALLATGLEASVRAEDLELDRLERLAAVVREQGGSFRG